MRKLSIVAVFLLILTASGIVLAQSGSYVSPATGSTYTGTSPITVTGTVIACPTCGTGTGNVTAGTLTSNVLTKGNGTTGISSSSVTDDGTKVSTTEPLASSGAQTSTVPALALTGTILTTGTPTPYLFLNPGGGSPTLSSSGTLIAGYTPAFGGNFLEFFNNSTTAKWFLDANGTINAANSGAYILNGSTGQIQGKSFATLTNCSAAGTAASPSVVSCSAAAAGAFSCATNASGATCTVNTTAVTTNSDIVITQTASAGTRLSVTCNTTADTPTGPRIASISNGTSFTINLGTVSTNPTCYFYTITN